MGTFDIFQTKEELVRTFDTGATRSANDDKLDFRGFLSPITLRSYAEYMHKHRHQADGTLRASDNWKKGIPLDSFMESMWRHFFAVWEGYEKGDVQEEDLAALFFNVHGFMHEWLKKKPETINDTIEKLKGGL